MKTHRTCSKCKNAKPYKCGEFSLLCKKLGIEVCADDCCEDFVPKTCTDCALYIPISERLGSSVCRISACKFIINACEDFRPKTKDAISNILYKTTRQGRIAFNILADKVHAAAKKAATTGNCSDLRTYLKLRREML